MSNPEAPSPFASPGSSDYIPADGIKPQDVPTKVTRYPALALFLSVLTLGLGHIYCGRVVRGVMLYALAQLQFLFWAVALSLPPSNGIFIGLMVLPTAITFCIFIYGIIDAYRIAKRAGTNYAPRRYNRAWVYISLLVASMIYSPGKIYFFESYIGGLYISPVSSMNPSVRKKDRFIVSKIFDREEHPERGTLVVFYPPQCDTSYGNISEQLYIKRVIAIAGDTLEMKGKSLLINGKELRREPVEIEDEVESSISGDEYFLEDNGSRTHKITLNDEIYNMNKEHTIVFPENRSPDHRIYEKITVPENSVFVLGDNRDSSLDSRYFGPVPMERVVGYAHYIYFPVDSWSRFGVID